MELVLTPSRALGVLQTEFVELLYRARKISGDRITLGAIREQDKKKAYFFAVLRDLLEESEGEALGS